MTNSALSGAFISILLVLSMFWYLAFSHSEHTVVDTPQPGMDYASCGRGMNADVVYLSTEGLYRYHGAVYDAAELLQHIRWHFGVNSINEVIVVASSETEVDRVLYVSGLIQQHFPQLRLSWRRQETGVSASTS